MNHDSLSIPYMMAEARNSPNLSYSMIDLVSHLRTLHVDSMVRLILRADAVEEGLEGWKVAVTEPSEQANPSAGHLDRAVAAHPSIHT
jgi:hypothetical protein